MDDSELSAVSFYFSASSTIPACLTQAEPVFQAESGIEFKANVPVDDIQYEVLSGKKCLIVFAINTREEQTKISEVLPELLPSLREKRVIILICSKDMSEKTEEFFRKAGCAEVLPYNIPSKSFQYKVRRYLKLLEQTVIAAPVKVVQTVSAKIEDPLDEVWKLTAKDEEAFATGMDAMKPCGLKGILKGEEFELLEYDEEKGIILIGTILNRVELKESVNLQITPDNLSLKEPVSLQGYVSRIDELEPGRQVAVILLPNKSIEELSKIRAAVEKRQLEVISFFNKAKGIG